MSKLLIIRDVVDFGVIYHPKLPKFGMDLSQSLIHAYLVTHTRWGMGRLETNQDFETFVATVMEDVDGFHYLTECEQDLLLYESVHYLQCFIDYTDSMPTEKAVEVFPPERSHRRVALLVW